MYEIIYDTEEENNIRESFEGTWDELQDHIDRMRESGCFNISATDLLQGYEDFEEETEYEEKYTSSTNGDYSPSCPWNAPGMSISDFI